MDHIPLSFEECQKVFLTQTTDENIILVSISIYTRERKGFPFLACAAGGPAPAGARR